MHLIKSFLIAISMYSAIPVPHTEWKEEDMKYVFCFFPFVGVITGGMFFGWNYLCLHFALPEILRVAISLAIPVIISGGIHVDGFMDTMDAFHSYRDREKKLEILKDPHIGAFSVIMLGVYALVFGGSLAVLQDPRTLAVMSITFVTARCISAFAAVTFKSAREGMLRTLSSQSAATVVRVVAIIEALLCVSGTVFIQPVYAAIACATVLLCTLYYYLRTKKEFGGVTGDTAGFLVLLCENGAAVMMAVFTVVMTILQMRVIS